MFGAGVKQVDTTERRVALEDGARSGTDRLISTRPLEPAESRMSDLRRDLRAAARHLEYSSTHVVGVGRTALHPPRSREC